MQQSNVIFAALIIAWIVFITIRGELPSYLALLKGNASQASLNPQSSSPGAGTASQPGSLYGSVVGVFSNMGANSGTDPQIFGSGSTSGGLSGASLFPQGGS